MTMPLIDHIQALARQGQVEWSSHARKKCYRHNINPDAVINAIASGCELVENYPDDPRGHSCLVLTFEAGVRPLHVVLGVADPSRLVIITVYEPDPHQWIDWRVRRK
ncbi:protein of unknown function (DUF4258) [Candidatus Fervidibacteria bacterium JGI MDM2 SSWTFF-3-K9]